MNEIVGASNLEGTYFCRFCEFWLNLHNFGNKIFKEFFNLIVQEHNHTHFKLLYQFAAFLGVFPHAKIQIHISSGF